MKNRIAIGSLIVGFIALALLVSVSSIAFAKPPSGSKGGGTFPAPSGLTATAVSASQINLSWTDNSSNEDGFKVERSLNGSSFSEIASVGTNVNSFSNAGLSSETTYYYRVRAFEIKGSKTKFSTYSNVANDTTSGVPPAAPSTLLAQTASASSTSWVAVSWSDNSDNESSFEIERGTDGATFVLLDTVGMNASGYDDFSVTSGTTYYYRARATNSFGSSAYSNTASVTAS